MNEDPAFREAFELYANSLLAMSYAYVKDWATAEDIVQDVFLKYWQQRDQFRGESKLKTYLTAICINACKDYLKSWRYRTHTLTNHFLKAVKPKQPLHLQQERSEIGEAVLSLPLQFREPIYLYYYEGYTYREVSELLNVPESTVRNRINRGKNMLKDLLPNTEWEVLIDEA